jgi:hypothetical protein
LPFKETAVDYYWRHFKEPRNIFGSWVVVIVDLKSFSADTSDILGAILRKENVVANSLGCSNNGWYIWYDNGGMYSGSKMRPHRVGVARHHDDDKLFCSAYFNAGEARGREINRVVCSAASCGNGVASGNQIFDALIHSCVGEGFGHSPRRAQLGH